MPRACHVRRTPCWRSGRRDAAGLLRRRHHRHHHEIRPARLLAVAGHRPHAENHFLAGPIGGRDLTAVGQPCLRHRWPSHRGNLPGAGGPLVLLELVRRAGAQIQVQRRRNGVALGGLGGNGELDDNAAAALHGRQIAHARRNIGQRRQGIAHIAAPRQQKRCGCRQKSIHEKIRLAVKCRLPLGICRSI